MSIKELKPMSMDAFSILTEMYRPYWPQTLPACTYFETLKRWNSIFPEVKITVLGVDGQPQNGTFVAVVWAPCQYVFIESLNENLNSLKKMLLNCEYIDWTKQICIGPLRSKFHSIIEQIFLEKRLVRVEHDLITDGYWLDNFAARNTEVLVREDVIIGEVTEKYAELINDLWPHKTSDTLQLVTYMLRCYPGVGVFHKESNELLCWILRDEYGGLGLLQTIEAGKRKGYGSLAVAHITKMYGQENKNPHLYIVKSNKISQALFAKFGYKKYDAFTWFTVGEQK